MPLPLVKGAFTSAGSQTSLLGSKGAGASPSSTRVTECPLAASIDAAMPPARPAPMTQTVLCISVSLGRSDPSVA